MPANVNKYNGFTQLKLDNTANTFVFGNDHNDLELMQNFTNSVMLGHHAELAKYAKVRINYDDNLYSNFKTVINTILGK